MYCMLQAVACWVCVSVVNSGHIRGKHVPKHSTYLESNGMVIVSSMYIWPLALFSTVMFLIHTALALGNVTTFEVGGGTENIDYLKGTKECDLPFSRVSLEGGGAGSEAT